MYNLKPTTNCAKDWAAKASSILFIILLKYLLHGTLGNGNIPLSKDNIYLRK